MDIKLPSETIFHAIESTIKSYRKFSQRNISAKIKDMTIDQGMVLLFLNEYPELTQKEIAVLVFRDNASMTRMINTMVEKKYLLRTMNTEDRRRFRLEITQKGKDVLKVLPGIIKSNRSKSLSGLNSEEIHQLGTLLTKIKTNITKNQLS